MMPIKKGGEMPSEIEVKIGKIDIEDGAIKGIELTYIPDQTQIFRAGRRYKFVLDIQEGNSGEEKKDD